MGEKELINNKYFDLVSKKYCYVSRLLKWADSVNKRLALCEPDTELEKLDYNTLTDILFDTEKISLNIRMALNEKDTTDKMLSIINKNNVFTGQIDNFEQAFRKEQIEDYNNGITPIAFKNLPISCDFNGELVSVFTPLTFKRGFKNKAYITNYMLSIHVSNALYKWQNDNQISLAMKLQGPLFLVIKRTGLSFSPHKTCDGDNIENQMILNAICSQLSTNDNAKNMTLISCFDIVESEQEVGTYFYIFEEKNLDKYKYLYTNRRITNAKKGTNDTRLTKGTICTLKD